MGKTARPFFVAEVSSNHHRDLDRCLAFIDEAARIGCNAVKFQLFRINELFAPEILAQSEEHRKRKAWELPTEFLPMLSTRCREQDIEFGCTPFYLRAVDELLPHVDFYKIASYELLWKELLSTCARTGKPVVISTGMATMDEVRRAVDVLMENGCTECTILHCVSGYPTPVAECNLAAIESLRTEIVPPVSEVSLRFGWSDHSVRPEVIYRAVHRWNAETIEFHLDLEGAGEEFKTGHCWLPDQISPVIRTIRQGFDADGDGEKTPSPSEVADRDWRADPSDGLRPILDIRSAWRCI
jgi:N-acetylneuraminate synthase